MDDLVHEIRGQQWAEIIAACNSSGQGKAEWCRENGVNVRQFYYWQRKLRNEMYEASRVDNCTALEPREAANSPAVFAELQMASPMMPPPESKFCATAVIRVGAVTMEISNNASKQLVESLGKVICNAVQRNRF